MKRTVTVSVKKQVAGRQSFKCANNPKNKLRGLHDYLCPLWITTGSNRGCFDESGYEIDHITEHCLTGNDNITNLQALCSSCHKVKTKRFNQTNRKIINKHPIFGKLIKTFSSKEQLYIASSNDIGKYVTIWSRNRPPDKKRIKEVVEYIKKSDRVDGIIYVAQIEDKFVCYDGNHRREACKLLDKSYPVLVELLIKPTYHELCAKFQALNKCVPVSELYSDPNRYSNELKLLVLEIVNKICSAWPEHQATSKNPRRPNFNKDLLETQLTNFITENNICYSKEILWDKLLKLNNRYKKGNLDKYTPKMLEKCCKTDCYLFLKNDLTDLIGL